MGNDWIQEIPLAFWRRHHENVQKFVHHSKQHWYMHRIWRSQVLIQKCLRISSMGRGLLSKHEAAEVLWLTYEEFDELVEKEELRVLKNGHISLKRIHEYVKKNVGRLNLEIEWLENRMFCVKEEEWSRLKTSQRQLSMRVYQWMILVDLVDATVNQREVPKIKKPFVRRGSGFISVVK